MSDRRGFILITTFIMMIVLTVMVSSVLFLLNSEIKDTGGQIDDYKLLALADAGVDRGYRALRDDYDTTTQTGVADLRGGDTALSLSMTNPTNLYYIDTSYATINNNADQAIIRNFDSNYINTNIVSVIPYVQAGRATGGSGSTIVFSYTLDGASYTTLLTQALPNSTALVNYPGTAIAGLTWAQIISPNFRLRTIRTAGNRNAYIGSMYLRITYSVDTLTEPWATGSYAAFPISLGDGSIQSSVITDEASKIHLNYASQALIQNLLTNLSIANAATKAADIVTYRGAALANPFDSVVELQRVASITAADYTAIKDYFTVYSYVNQNCYNSHVVGSTPVPRAPVNINTAPLNTLKAIFDPLGLGVGDSTSLANAIITRRNSTPFTCFYSSNAAVTTDLVDFVNSQAYLTTAERNTVQDNADPSLLAPISGFTNAVQTTELCYAGIAFNINSLARIGAQNFRVNTMRNSSGGSTFTNYVSDTSSVGWRAENFE